MTLLMAGPNSTKDDHIPLGQIVPPQANTQQQTPSRLPPLNEGTRSHSLANNICDRKRSSTFNMQDNKSRPENGTTATQFMIGGSDEDLENREECDVREGRVVPPDGGWGWVVMIASFLCNVMVDGIIFTSGMLFTPIMKEFNISYAQVSWVSSLLGGFYLLAGPFVSSLANAFGFRTVCILGSVVTAGACVVSHFATDIYYLYFSYGILGGIGFGFIYVPAVIATGFYFERRRAFATGIAVCGSGIGTFCIAPLNSRLIATVGWRGVMLVNAGLVLTCGVFGLAFRPLSAATGKVVHDPPDDLQGTSLLQSVREAQQEDAAVEATGPPFKNTSRTRSTVGRKSVANHWDTGRHDSVPIFNVTTTEAPGEEEEEEAGSTDVKEEAAGDKSAGIDSNALSPPSNDATGRKQLDSNKNETGKDLLKAYAATEIVCTRNLSCPHLSLYNTGIADGPYRRASRVTLDRDNAQPFLRDDIFYSGSMQRLPHAVSSDTVARYRASITLSPLDALEEESSGWVPNAVKAVIYKIFDFSLCTSPTFIILCVAGFMSLLSLFVPFNFLPSFIAKQQKDFGLTDEEADQTKAFVMSLIGICNTVGRVACGWIADHPKVDAILVNNVALFIGGVSTMLLPFITNISLLYLYAVVFGFSVAVFASLRSILLVELLGLEKLTNAFGLLLLVQGVAACFGSPIAGGFADATDSFNITFYVFGFIYALSGLMCIPLRRVKRWEVARQEEKEKLGC